MSTVLLPKATATWLIENTKLTFKQIADFCGLNIVEVQTIADGEIGGLVCPLNPIINGQLTAESISACEEDENKQLELVQSKLPQMLIRSKGQRYTPLSKRSDRPYAIFWCITNHPELSDSQLIKLIGTTSKTIASIREKTHWNYENLQARSPAELDLCSYSELQAAIKKAEERSQKQQDSEEEKI